MPLVRDRCNGCNKSMVVCPECGSGKVTPLDNLKAPSPRKLVIYNKDREVTYKSVCWDCGWSEKVKVTVEPKPL